MLDLMQRKKRENITAYVISMWHLEDVLRANGLDIAAVHELLVDPLDVDDATKDGVRAWYVDLIRRMQQEGIVRAGHLAEVLEVMEELQFMHDSMMNVLQEPAYAKSFMAVEPDVRLLQERAGEDAVGVIETCLTAVYGVMLLKAQEKQVGAETEEAVGRIRAFLEDLSKFYLQVRRLPGISLN